MEGIPITQEVNPEFPWLLLLYTEAHMFILLHSDLDVVQHIH